MIGTDEFVRRLNQGSRFQVQRTNDAAGAYRLLPPSENASGHVDGYFDYQNLSLTIRKLQARDEFFDDESGLGRLVFLLHLSGSRRVELGFHNHELSRPTLAVYYQPRGLVKRSVWSSGSNELSLSVGIWPKRLNSLFGFYPPCFPRFSGQHEGSQAFWYSRPLPYSVMSAAEQLLSPSIHPQLSKCYIAVKSQELLCLSVSALLSDGQFLSRADLRADRVEQVKTMVDANLKAPPSLSSIASAFCLPVEELSNEFRLETGMTFAQYTTERRMKRAMIMLESGAIPLKQVAFEVGYSHSSNFCTAFKRHFGSTPKDVRG
ncbi:helix-turn-helix transcriptional regulator [Sinorhizobium numidicum]|uniref:helix-turn-helix transcriptional regulator n=2 Tax=Sinorhizobium numidicum TaxID=680248 RepID=UPI003CC88B64